MGFFAFTGLGGSLLHPLGMLFVCLGWFAVSLLGLKARKKRLEVNAQGEGASLIRNGSDAKKTGRHQKAAATLLFLTILFMFGGMANTYGRDGRLYPGRHLYGALLMVTALCANVALSVWFDVNKSLRNVHAAIGVFVLCIVVSQMYSGFKITLAVVRHFLR